MSASAEAWLLEPGGGFTLAIGTMELAHVVTAGETRLQRVPCAPHHCACALLWNGAPVPVLDVARRLSHDYYDESDEGQHLLGLVQYQVLGTAVPAAGAPMQLGALRLTTVPRRHGVTDDRACPLPTELGSLAPFSLACFRGPAGEAIPVVDLSKLFAAA